MPQSRGRGTSSGMAERTLEVAQNASLRRCRLLLPLHDSLGVFTDAQESGQDGRVGGSAARGMAPSAAVAPQSSGDCSFPYHSLYTAGWRENYNVHIASAKRLRRRDQPVGEPTFPTVAPWRFWPSGCLGLGRRRRGFRARRRQTWRGPCALAILRDTEETLNIPYGLISHLEKKKKGQRSAAFG